MYRKKFIIGNCYLNNLKQFWHVWPPVTLTLDPKNNRVPLLPWTDVWTKFKEGRSWRSQVIGWKRFWHIWPQWPWPLTPKSMGFICCPGRMCGHSLRKVGQGILELLIGNEKGTEGQTLPTDRHLQSNMPSLLRRGA